MQRHKCNFRKFEPWEIRQAYAKHQINRLLQMRRCTYLITLRHHFFIYSPLLVLSYTFLKREKIGTCQDNSFLFKLIANMNQIVIYSPLLIPFDTFLRLRK